MNERESGGWVGGGAAGGEDRRRFGAIERSLIITSPDRS